MPARITRPGCVLLTELSSHAEPTMTSDQPFTMALCQQREDPCRPSNASTTVG
ncbi:hypothetical protein HMPREF9595_00963 [Cutibacterium acnes HL005PA2]|nr:hypothetical protein HMPREF9595_00963 [Cutibacterium acnes HL005PA2]